MADVRYLPGSSAPFRADVSFLAPAEVERVRSFHRSIPQYRLTELHSLDDLADSIGVEAVLLKDESRRFGLGAFKVLGGVWAMARCLAEHFGLDPAAGFPHLKQQALGRAGEVTFVTATAGNHGRGVAWAAEQFGCGAVVLVPEGTATARIDRIRSHGARVEVAGAGFDEVVERARHLADANGWTLLQDTAWEGYERIPRWIVQGYGTMVAEALEQVEAGGSERPSHVVLQVGVGSFAAAVTGYLAARYRADLPRIYSVEPEGSAGLYLSVERAALTHLERSAPTAMTCLACTEISLGAWPMLRDGVSGHFACGDRITELGQRRLAAAGVASGPSGAVGAGLVAALGEEGDLVPLRDEIGMGGDARILLFSTEGRPDGGA